MLDSNQARGAGDLLLHMLKTVADQSGHELKLPELVWDEVLAHRHREAEDWIRKLGQAQKELLRWFPGWRAAESPDPALAVERRRQQLARVFGKLPMPDAVFREGMVREVWRRPPAKPQGESAVGGRDAAIWLSVVSACLGGQEVHFVSQDNGFCSGGGLHEELEKDFAEQPRARERFRLHKTVPELLGVLAQRDQYSLDRGQLDVPTVQEAVVAALSDDTMLMYELMRDTGLWETATAVGRTTGSLRLEFRPRDGDQRTHAYRVGKERFATGVAVWRGCQPVTLSGPTPTAADIEFSVQTTVVVKRGTEGEITQAEVAQRGRCRDVELLR